MTCNSPDLKSIQHLCDVLEIQVQSMAAAPHNSLYIFILTDVSVYSKHHNSRGQGMEMLFQLDTDLLHVLGNEALALIPLPFIKDTIHNKIPSFNNCDDKCIS